MSPTWVTFLFETANFLGLAALLGWLFFRPVRNALEQRREALAEEGKRAAEARTEAEGRAQELAGERRRFEGSLAALRKQVQDEAEQERQRTLTAGREQVERERQALRAELSGLRRGQARAALGDAVEITRELVERLLARIDGPELEAALAGAAGRELGRLAEKGPLEGVIVESAQPLPDERAAALAAAAGVEAGKLEQRVVPELRGGVRVLSSCGLVDASVAGLAAWVGQALATDAGAGEEAADG